MRTIYACVLDVSVKSPETSTQGFERLWFLVAQWVETLYRQRWKIDCHVSVNGPKAAPLPYHGLHVQREQVSGVCELIALEWSYPDDQDAGLQWITTCQLARNGPRLEASIAIRIVSTHPIAKPLSYTLKRPSLVDQILQNFSCAVGKSPLPLKPRELDRFEIDLFVEETLCSSSRWLPIVAISPEQGMRDYLANPEDLQQALLGHAQVVAFRDVSAGRAWTESLRSKELSCYLGAVRLYWPGFTRQSKPVEHPLYLPDSIRWHTEQQQPLSQHLFRTLVAVSGFRFSNPPVARLVREAIEGEKYARFQHMLENQKSLEEAGQIMRELERVWDEVEQLKLERDEARNQVSELTRELESQKAAWATFRGQRPGTPSLGAAPLGAAISEAPPVRAAATSVVQAVRRAQEDFPGTLVFLPSALESAEVSPYRWPDKVHALFQALDELTRRWQQSGSIGSGWHQALKPKGFDYSEFISPTAKGKFGDEYTFTYEGRPVLFEHHVTLGARSADTCISIHWYRDEARKCLILGWCGKHLSNTLS